MNITNSEMMQATIEIFGSIVSFMLAAVIMMNGYARKTWRVLKWMFITISIIFISDAFNYIFSGNIDMISIVCNRLFSCLKYICNLVLLCLYAMHLSTLLQEKGMQIKKIYINILKWIIVFSALALLSTHFTGWMYYFDEDNYFHSSFGWYVYSGLYLLGIILCMIMYFIYRKNMQTATFKVQLMYLLVPVISYVIQLLFENIAIYCIGLFISMTILLLAYLKEWKETQNCCEKKHKSFKSVMLLLIMFTSISVSMVTFIISISRLSEKESVNHSHLIAHMIYDEIENEFTKSIVVSDTMSKDYSLKQYLKKSQEERTIETEKEIVAYLDSIRKGFDYPLVYVVSNNDKAYYSYKGFGYYLDMQNCHEDYWYKNMIDPDKNFVVIFDTDKTGKLPFAAYVNYKIFGNDGTLLGICGVEVDTTKLLHLLQEYEKSLDIDIAVIDQNGQIQLDTDSSRMGSSYLDASILNRVTSDTFYIQEKKNLRCLTKYSEKLNCYIVIEDHNPDKISAVNLTTPGVITFIIGMLVMGVVFFVITERERKTARELVKKEHISMTDNLTGLPNRRAFDEACEKIENEHSLQKKIFIMMDLNGLKNVNDNYGHIAGDEYIIGAAECMVTTMVKYGNVYRIGGDEFFAILECTKEQLNDLLGTFEYLISKWKGNYDIELSISKGIAIAKENRNLNLKALKELADKLMYEEKKQYYMQNGKQYSKRVCAEV